MTYTGFLKGMTHTYTTPVTYHLPLGETEVILNDLLDRDVHLRFLGEIQCIHCGRRIKKTYNSGYCYPCVISLAETDLCMVKPHECHYHLGTCRDPEFGETHCMIPHYVYLAVSSGVKVGLTRKHNQMKRWVDQGAIQAIPIAEVPSRKKAGELEVALAEHLPDKTDWRKMLRGDVDPVNLTELRDEVCQYIPGDFKDYLLKEEEWVEFVYPMLESIEKIKSYNLDKKPEIKDRVVGIKGQYLVFQQGVIHIKKYSGYKVEISV